MELRHLRYFKAVAELLNFSRAAEKLRVAQPALSRQVQALEAEIGVPLLDRNRVRVRLTDAGRTFLAHATRVLAQVDIGVTAAQVAGAGASGELVICYNWGLEIELVPATVAAFRRRFPLAEVTLRDTPFYEQLVLVRSRRAHLGFVERHLLGERGDLSSLRVFHSRIVIVLPVQHPLARNRTVRLADLAAEQWITIAPKQAPEFRKLLTRECRLSGFTPRFSRTAASREGLWGHVASGYGITLDLERANAPASSLVRCIPSDCEPVDLYAVWHPEEKSPLLRSFLEMLRAQVSRRSGAAAAARPARGPAPAPRA